MMRSTTATFVLCGCALGTVAALVTPTCVKIMNNRSSSKRTGSKQDIELEDMKLDISSLDAEERKRVNSLRSIQESMKEVDEMESKFMQMAADQQRRKQSYDDEDDDKDIAILDTQWSGQAGLDITVKDNKNWADIGNRLGLAIGDVAALTLFAYIGRSTHGDRDFDLEVIKTALPFIAGWLGVAPLLGAYTNDATASQKDMIKTLVPSWIVSIPVGLAIRGVIKGDVPPIPFVVVSMVATGAALTAWRAVYVVFNPTSVATSKRGGILDGFRMITTLLQRW